MKKLFIVLLMSITGLFSNLSAQTVNDTIYYPFDNLIAGTGQATLFNLIPSNIAEVGQFFTVPSGLQNAQVTGVVVFFGSKRQVATSDVYNIGVYNTGVDSLPLGLPTTSTTYTTSGIDTTTAVGFNIYNFPTPATINNGRFAITFEIAAPAKNDTNYIFSSGQGDGQGHRRALLKLNNNAVWQQFANTWQKAGDVFYFQNTTDDLDVDFIILPIYRYDQNPYAQFSASTTNTTVGQTVTFTNTSTGIPTPTYSWAFNPATVSYVGGTNSTSANPQVQFTAPGTYSVTLTANNSNGTDTEIKTNYIFVALGGGGSTPFCDTIFNFGVSDQPITFTFTNEVGYVGGHNGYQDISKAERFVNPNVTSELNRAFLFFGVAKAANNNKTIKVRVWDNTGTDAQGNAGAPGAVLREQDVIITSIPTNGDALQVNFNPPVSITTNFFIGISYTYAVGDTVALLLNDVGQTAAPGTAWEQWGPNPTPPVWYPFFVAYQGASQSFFIMADICAACPTITATAANVTNNTSCTAANGSFSVNASGGSTPYQYNVGSGFQSTNSFTGLAAGSYTVTVRDANNCTATVSATINNSANNPTLTVGTPTANSSCITPNGAVTITLAGGTPNYSYSVTGPNGYSQAGVSPIAAPLPLTGLVAGTYNGTVTDANGCSATATAVIPNNAPTVTLTQGSVTPNTACGTPNGAFTVNVTSGTAPYSFTANGLNSTIGTFNGVAGAVYVVNVTDANGCTGTINVTVPENAPTVTLSQSSVTPNTTCGTPNGAFTVSATNGASPYTYTVSGVSNSTGTFTGLAGNTYTVNVVDANGCTGTLNVVVVNNALTLNAQITNNSPNTSCVSPNGAITVSATNGAAPYTYNNGIATNQSGQFANLAASTYVVTVTDANSCTGTVSATVVNQANPPALTVQSNTPNTACVAPYNGSFSINATGGSAPYTYAIGGVTNQTGSFTALQGGSYPVTVTGANGCTATINVDVLNQPTTLNVQVGNNTANTSCTNANGSFMVSATGGNAPYTYNIAGATNQTGTFNGLSASTYNITVSDAAGCSGTASVTVINNQATISLNTSSTLASSGTSPDGSASVTATGGTAPYDYEWSNGEDDATITGVLPGDYTVTVTDANSCSATATVTVQFTVSTASAKNALQLSIYPNPAKENVNVTVELNESMNISIEVFNVLGEKVIARNLGKTAKANHVINMNGLSEGVYMIRVNYGEKTAVRRVVLNK